jgi:hypothetical protein
MVNTLTVMNMHFAGRATSKEKSIIYLLEEFLTFGSSVSLLL